MGCVQCVWLSGHNIAECYHSIKIEYFKYRVVTKVSINGEWNEEENDILINKFYICNGFHDIPTLQSFVGYKVNMLTFYYKNKYVVIDLDRKTISVDYDIEKPIILGDISLTNCEVVD